MQKVLSLMFLIFSLQLLACKNKANPSSMQSLATETLQHLLQNTFNTSIVKHGRHYYFLVPDVQCKACNVYTANRIKEEINNQLTIISGFPSSHFTGYKSFLFDSTEVLNTLPLVNYSNKLIVTEDGNVVSVCNPGFDLYAQLDSLSKVDFKQ